MVQDLFLAFIKNIGLRVRGVGLVVMQGKVGQFSIAFYLVEAKYRCLATLNSLQVNPENRDSYEGRS